MGTNTPFLDLFKPDSNDPVDRTADFNDNSDKVDAWAQSQAGPPTEIHDQDQLADVDATYFIHGAGFGSPTVYMPTPVTPGRRITIVQLDGSAVCHVASPGNVDAFSQTGSQVNVVNVVQFLGVEAGVWAVLQLGVPS